MEVILELITELFIEGSIALVKNQKGNKWIRYPIMIILEMMIFLVVGLLFFCGYCFLEENRIIALFFFGIGIFMVFKRIKKWKEVYQPKRKIIKI